MNGFTPLIRVTVNGKEVAGAFYTRLIKATLRDEAGQSSDTCTIDLDDRNNEIEAPAKDDVMSVEIGWRETGLTLFGEFKVQSTAMKGSVSAGETMTIQAKGTDLKNKLKGEGNESFSNKTFGDIVKASAKRAGLTPEIDAELAAIQYAYKARTGQSEIDFLTRLADEAGGTLKVSAKKLAVVKRGGGKSASGKALAPILINRRDCAEWEFTPDGRPQYGRVVAPWTDNKDGKRKIETAETGLKGPDHVLRESEPTKPRAKKKAEAEAQRLNRGTGAGEMKLYGRPEAQAEADVICSGFRPEINGTWRCKAVEHEFTQGAGFITKIEVSATEKGKKGGIKDE